MATWTSTNGDACAGAPAHAELQLRGRCNFYRHARGPKRVFSAIDHDVWWNGYRTRLWDLELQRFANESGLRVTVEHKAPGTGKLNKIERRMFCHITQDWPGRPLESIATVVSLIGTTETRTGLGVKASLTV